MIVQISLLQGVHKRRDKSYASPSELKVVPSTGVIKLASSSLWRRAASLCASPPASTCRPGAARPRGSAEAPA